MFDKEWKMKAHLKTHKLHKCDNCKKTFKNEDILEKHLKIAHEGLKIYCHYFNNEKECPFNEKCIFLHENSSQCKYGKLCERTNCMYKHIAEDNYEENEEIEEDDISDDECDIEDVDDDNGVAENTFFNPSVETETEKKAESETEEFKWKIW